MKVLRRFLGSFVMLAGFLGLALSLAGLVMVWVARPTVNGYLDTTLRVLENSLDTSGGTVPLVVEINGQFDHLSTVDNAVFVAIAPSTGVVVDRVAFVHQRPDGSAAGKGNGVKVA